MEFIHRDIARYLVFLVIIRVLVCVTLRDLKPVEWSHRSPEHRVRDGVTVRRQQRPRDAGNTLPHSRQMAAGHACRPGSADVTTQPPELRAVGASGHAAKAPVTLHDSTAYRQLTTCRMSKIGERSEKPVTLRGRSDVVGSDRR